MTAETSNAHYRERLVPGFGFFVAWLLVIPAVALIMMPINAQAAIPTAIAMYVVIAIIFFALSPIIEVSEGQLQAGRAVIPVEFIGKIEPLGSELLRKSIGQDADARNYLLVRGWIHMGLKLEIADENDPTPYWIITSRKPLALAEAIRPKG
ncbi:DUF3093 domain-containing protein [Leucobacter denitrificans]|uniref:DUF3093 domain-containing protein n=1 Tax=Leucobacter denitrificans TaxID=683042 RepID=A0A7G9S5N7_9MICO|nr:DUF3093 domain-containing protein [Leucobacter denitrificans]QNN63162.1 DUF3093 domain-containing protein [Leucobacter denitrificans]